jgi:Adenosine deaminase
MSSAVRRSILPIEHLDAELLAAPLASRTAFARSLVQLDDNMAPETATLWREQERELLSRFPGMSVDELIIRRDRIWFGHPSLPQGQPRSLLGLLRHAARELLDGAASASPGPSELERRRIWRWVKFALPADLLCVAIDRRPDRITFPTTPLELALRDGGFVEPHLHLKAAAEFPLLWSSLQRAISEPGVDDGMLAGPGAEFDEGRDFAAWLVRAALSRLALAGFLTNPVHRPAGFGSYLREKVLRRIAELEGPLASTMFRSALREVAAGTSASRPAPFARLRHLYASLARPTSTQGLPASLDPLDWWFPAVRWGNPEHGFLKAAFTYLDEPRGREDRAFVRLFWQVQRLRVSFYRHIVQRPMTPGLQWFTRTYDRLSKPRAPLGVGTFLAEAARLAGPGLRSLEVRVAPGNRMSDLVQTVTKIDAAAQSIGAVETGIVFHFIRSRGPDAQSGVPRPWSRDSHDDPGSRRANPAHYRFSGYYLQRRGEAAALASLLLSFPRMLERIRGLDLCTDELGIPLWVLLPILEHVRRAGDLAAKSLQAARDPVRPLRLTVHAGEDFVHLLGSIRRVGEAVEYLRLGGGDRIGHAVSLGVDVSEWAARATGLAIPRGERLFDLLWAVRCTRRSDDAVLRSWLPYAAHEARRLGALIFGGEHPKLTELEEWVSALYSTTGLARAGFPSGPPPSTEGPRTDQLVLQWLRDTQVFARSQELEAVNIAAEVALVAALQAHVRKQLALTGIVVEINPSSNLLIGHLGDLTSHPLWRLHPPIEGAGDAPPVRVCIGSDDPITFATRLPDEYQLLADAMVEGGLSMHQVDAWLDHARLAGLAARFTVPRSKWSLTSPAHLPYLPLRL